MGITRVPKYGGRLAIQAVAGGVCCRDVLWFAARRTKYPKPQLQPIGGKGWVFRWGITSPCDTTNASPPPFSAP